MKKILLIITLLLIVVFLCSCGTGGDTIQEEESSISEEETGVDSEGYFEDVVFEKSDEFGEKTGEDHAIIATVHAQGKNGDDQGIVKVEYCYDFLHEQYGFSFKFLNDTRIGTTLVQQMYYKINDTKYEVDTDKLSHNILYSSDLPDDFSKIFETLYDGQDVQFSFSYTKSSGPYFIFTLHGKGFSKLVDKA